MFTVQINANNTLEFNEEGAVSVSPDGSLVYLANGATLVDHLGNTLSAPVPNYGSISPAFVEQSEISVALSPYFFSRFGLERRKKCLFFLTRNWGESVIWGLGEANELSVSVASAPASSPIQVLGKFRSRWGF